PGPLDGRHRRRQLGCALRAHLHPYPRRGLGADRPRRWPGEAGRARDPLRRGLMAQRVGTKPFLLLSIRAERAAAENEYESFLRFTGLAEAELPLVNLAAEELPSLDLDDWSGILLGGGPWNASDDPGLK